MKQVFYKGLLALTIAFGVTSCDKNDGETSNLQMTQSEVKAGLASKVTFSETGAFVGKGKSNVAGKTAAQFSHIYSETPQSLIITNDAGIQYTGSYAAGNISSLDPSEILLANGDYTATSSNASNDGLGFIAGFAPYTSTIGFNLSASGSIALAVTHERGFVVANSEGAIDGNRITSVVLSAGDVSGDLLLDSRDDFNDFYGYLEAGTYNVVINYMLDGSPATKTGSVEIAVGVASTLAPMLDEETPEPTVTTDVQSEVVTSTEAVIRDGAGFDVNGDGDMLDGITRTVTTTTITTDGVPGTPDINNGPWAVLEGQNVNDLSVGEDSGLGDTIPDAADEYISSAAAAVETGGESSSDDPAFGAWVVVEAPSTQALTSRSRTRVVRTTTTARLSTVVTSYSIMVNGDEDVPALEAKSDTSVETILVQGTFVDATETETEDDFANPDYVTPNGVDTWDVTGTYGGEEVLGAITYNAAPSDTSVATYTRIGTQAYSVNAAGNVETYSVVDAQDGDIVDGATRNVETAAAQSGLSRLASTEENYANPNYEEPSDEATTGTLTVAEVRATLGGYGNTYTISSDSGATVTAGDVITIVWGGTSSAGTVTVDITEADLADGAVTITVDRDFSTVTKS